MTVAPDDDLGPIDDANPADQLEQTVAAGEEVDDDEVDAEAEATDADLAEQVRVVPDSEDDYPHD